MSRTTVQTKPLVVGGAMDGTRGTVRRESGPQREQTYRVAGIAIRRDSTALFEWSV